MSRWLRRARLVRAANQAIVHRAAEAADIRHIGPGVVGGAGDKILTLHVGIAERVQEPPPDLLLRRDIKHEVDPVHSEPVELRVSTLIPPQKAMV